MDSARKQAVRDYVDAVGRGDADTISRLITEDYTHEFLGSTTLRGTRTREEILQQLETFSSALTCPGQFTFQEMIEEGDIVASIFSGKCELVNGKRFDGDYMAFCYFRDGKILKMRELIDTKLADSLFS